MEIKKCGNCTYAKSLKARNEMVCCEKLQMLMNIEQKCVSGEETKNDKEIN